MTGTLENNHSKNASNSLSANPGSATVCARTFLLVHEMFGDENDLAPLASAEHYLQQSNQYGVF
jgi:hypothetical protein